MVYIDKKPPVFVPDEGLQLDGKTVEGIPYFGEQMRGGVRVFLDNRLNASINENALEEAPSQSGPDGRKSWKLGTVLKQNGVDLSKVVEAWVIQDQKRKRKLTRAELDTVSFTTDPERKNALFLADTKERVDALALHSHALAPSELPQIRPDEAIN